MDRPSSYGHPKENSMSAARAEKAQQWIEKEIEKLMQQIHTVGSKDHHTGEVTVTFGHLFYHYQDVSDTLVGILLRAKKRKLIEYDGHMMFQGKHDHVVIKVVDSSSSKRGSKTTTTATTKTTTTATTKTTTTTKTATTNSIAKSHEPKKSPGTTTLNRKSVQPSPNDSEDKSARHKSAARTFITGVVNKLVGPAYDESDDGSDYTDNSNNNSTPSLLSRTPPPIPENKPSTIPENKPTVNTSASNRLSGSFNNPPPSPVNADAVNEKPLPVKSVGGRPTSTVSLPVSSGKHESGLRFSRKSPENNKIDRPASMVVLPATTKKYESRSRFSRKSPERKVALKKVAEEETKKVDEEARNEMKKRITEEKKKREEEKKKMAEEEKKMAEEKKNREEEKKKAAEKQQQESKRKSRLSEKSPPPRAALLQRTRGGTRGAVLRSSTSKPVESSKIAELKASLRNSMQNNSSSSSPAIQVSSSSSSSSSSSKHTSTSKPQPTSSSKSTQPKLSVFDIAKRNSAEMSSPARSRATAGARPVSFDKDKSAFVQKAINRGVVIKSPKSRATKSAGFPAASSSKNNNNSPAIQVKKNPYTTKAESWVAKKGTDITKKSSKFENDRSGIPTALQKRFAWE